VIHDGTTYNFLPFHDAEQHLVSMETEESWAGDLAEGRVA
jgi:hypothetical protein